MPRRHQEEDQAGGQHPPSAAPEMAEVGGQQWARSPDQGPGGLLPRNPLDLRAPDQRPGPRWPTLMAWLVILVLIAFQFALPLLMPPDDDVSPVEDAIGSITMRLQGRVLVAANRMMPDDERLRAQLASVEGGSIPQRLRYVVLAGELAGAEAARGALDDLRETIRSAQKKPDAPEGLRELPPEVVEVQELLSRIYAEESAAPELSEAERDLLVDELDWFGKLALYPPWTSDPMARRGVLAPAMQAFYVLMGMAMLLLVAGLAGFAGLVIMVALALAGGLRSGIEPSSVYHGLYAETFAVWLLLFFLLQVVAELVAYQLPQLGLLPASAAAFASLTSLAWPRIRGATWWQVRRDIGWTAGREPVVEPLLGFAGYGMTLPLVVVGVMMLVVLMQVDAWFAPPPGDLDPVGGPAHPVILQLGEGNPLVFLQVLLLGSVAAPIVEETMFRGILYRHLRGSSAWLGVGVSIILSTFLNTFIFAVIHPQGWVAWPALMSLAVGFTLMREWRGTLVPSMLMHGISNGIVLTMVALCLAE